MDRRNLLSLPSVNAISGNKREILETLCISSQRGIERAFEDVTWRKSAPDLKYLNLNINSKIYSH